MNQNSNVRKIRLFKMAMIQNYYAEAAPRIAASA
jgi:hypothetical protein